jgi:hypothetical protein
MAGMGRILTNDFSWSKSRDDKFQQCLRAYYLHYYKSWGGWDEEAPAEARRLYVLKKLSNRFSWAGAAVHEAIRHVLIGIRFGRNIETPKIIEGAHRLMQSDYLHSFSRRYWTEPYRRAFRGLVEHEYRDSVPREEWKQNWENARAALDWFFQSRWPVLARGLGPGQWLEIDTAAFEKSQFLLDGVRVFAIPDFAFIDQNGVPVVVDWKTGKSKDGYSDQVLGYALYLSARYGFAPETVRASVVYLNEGLEQLVNVDTSALENFKLRFRRSVDQMQELLVNRASNAPGEESRFPMTENLAVCARCAFRRACGREAALAAA